MMRVVVATIAIVITSGCRTATPAPLPMFEPSQIVDHAETLRVRVAGESVSVAILQLHVLSESVVSLIASASNDSLTQEILMTFDRVSLKPTRVRASNPLEVVDLVYSSERVWGKRVVWNPAGGQDTMDVNAPIDPGTLDRRHLLVVIPWLPLGRDQLFTVNIFDSWTRRSVPVRIAIGRESRITVPVGTFRAYRIELTTPSKSFVQDGGLFPTVLYVSSEAPHAILRIERPRQGAVSELISRRSPP